MAEGYNSHMDKVLILSMVEVVVTSVGSLDKTPTIS